MDSLGEKKKDRLDDLVEKEMEELAGEIDSDDLDKVKEVVREKVRKELDRELARIRAEKERSLKRDERLRQRRVEKEAKEEEEFFIRFNRNFRFQHMVMFTSVIILIFTGLPLKFPDFVLSKMMMGLWGGVKNSTIIHRIGAAMLIYFMVHHFFYTILSKDGRRDFVMLIPMPKDARDLVTNIRHFLGKNPERPRFDRFSYIEKFDYWAVYWGCVIMIGSGLILWFEEVSMKFLPKYWVDIAHEAHSDEALLATLAIVIWHFYNVHFNPDRFPGSLMWWHGKISKHEMIEEHPLEYERLMKEREEREKSGEVVE